ncbi:SURF1 family protein [Pseudomonas sp. 21LCFQ02]|uniref:SURF1 family protein n=1 Tax=Pseudomonas sp. 21LCFQ02 TaxID=2957505 RepID=UPI00209B95E4|nr:SURF1 family protein [Pseudomonas sp. 21LCFQ02]MCO8168940.1 SURF1 family protein [Pseudomonas sp. 21LCFQ02]
MRRFVAQPLPTLALMLLLPLLIGLGLWQLQRAEQKTGLLAAHQRQQGMPPAPLQAVMQATDPAWRRVALHGRFDAGHSLLLDNSSRDGRAGVELLQPFLDEGSGLWVLLNRGWLPWPDRRIAPAYSTPPMPLSLQAWVYVPLGRGFQLQADAPNADWPRLVTQVDGQRLWNELGRAGYPHELRLLPGMAAYRADWPVVNQAPASHRGYAVQWFSLAAALVGLYLYLCCTVAARRRP